VGRQASNKRLPTEAENLDNCLVTLEKSVEKRPPLEFLRGTSAVYDEENNPTDDFIAPGSLLFNIIPSTNERYQPTTEDDILFKWISIDANDRFLIAINFSLELGPNNILTNDLKYKFITVWRLNTTDKRMDLQTFDYSSLTTDHYRYITQNPDGKTAFNTFDFALFGSALIILNKQVSARFRDDVARDINGNATTVLSLSSTTDLANRRLFATFEDNQLDKFVLRSSDGLPLDLTFQGLNSAFQFGILPNILQVDVSTANTDQPVCSFFVKNYKENNSRVEFSLDDIDLISGSVPLNNGSDTLNTYKFDLTLYALDQKGRKLNYRVSALPDSVGKNLLPITENTKLRELDEDPRQHLFNGLNTGSATVFHAYNNLTDGSPAGNVKDPSAGASNDRYFADQFFVNRGSIQYSVQLIDHDQAKEPGSATLSPVEGQGSSANVTITENDLKVSSFLRPLTDFQSQVDCTSNQISNIDSVTTAVYDEDKTLKDLNDLIVNSGADAVLEIDSKTNQISVIDDSNENLVLNVDADNFTNGIIGNHKFVESLGLTVSNGKALRTVNRSTTLESLVDEEGEVLFPTADYINNIRIIKEQSVNLSTDTVNQNVSVHSIDLSNFAASSTLLQLAERIELQTNNEFGLYYANNNKRIHVGVENSDERSVGVQIMKNIPIDPTANPIAFKEEATTAALVIDSTSEAPLEEDNITVKRGRFAERIGIRNVARDYKLVVEDKNFSISQQTDLGQSIVSFQNIPIPTSENDTIKSNDASDSLFSLYEAGSLTTSAAKRQGGRGKIYEARERFFDFVPGFYRAVNEPDKGNPYYEIVRAEEQFSVLDERTWPIVIDFNTSSGTWSMVTPSWQPRKSGNLNNNPGPTPFIAADANKRVSRRITAITTWRNRLWFAIDDTIFSSEFNNFFNLFLTDPGTITDIDVIDVRSSLDKVSRINNIIPFYDFLFVNTDNDIQFELQGSENQITPFTAELSPTTFYSSDPIARPQLLGSQIYFFAPEKIYLYYSTANRNVLTQAVETTQHAEGYLPKNFGPITRGPAQDTILMVDGDETNTLYLYTQRFSGENVAQNSLSRYIFDEDMGINSMEVFDNFLYMVTTRPFDKKSGATKDYFFVERTFLESVNNSLPRLDRLHFFEPDIAEAVGDTVFNVSYDAATDKTTFILPYQDSKATQLVFGDGYGDFSNRSINCVNVTEAGKKTRLVVQGKFDDIIAGTEDHGSIAAPVDEEDKFGFISQSPEITLDNGFLYGVASGGLKGIFVGVPYKMSIELSPQFIRGENQTIVDGVLNLRTITTRYFNTGEYSIKVQRRGEEDFVSISTKRDPFYKETINNVSSIDKPIPISNEGEFIAKIFGDSAKMKVFIESDNFTPCNITHIEFKGVFKQHYRSGQN
jgi:hypothetical protein